MERKLTQSAAPVRKPDRLFIGGRWTAPSTTAKISVIDSVTEEPYFEVAAAQAEDIARAVAAAREAFDQGPWPRMSHAERGGYLRELAAALRLRTADIGELWPREAGALYALAAPYTIRAADEYAYYAGLADCRHRQARIQI